MIGGAKHLDMIDKVAGCLKNHVIFRELRDLIDSNIATIKYMNIIVHQFSTQQGHAMPSLQKTPPTL